MYTHLRAIRSQNNYEKLIAEVWTKREAREKIAQDGGQIRTDVTFSHVPKRGKSYLVE